MAEQQSDRTHHKKRKGSKDKKFHQKNDLEKENINENISTENPIETLIDEDNSNTDQLDRDAQLEDDIESSKTQRHIDDDEIPPPVLSNDEQNNQQHQITEPIIHSDISENIQNDERILTPLENPFEHNDSSSIQIIEQNDQFTSTSTINQNNSNENSSIQTDIQIHSNLSSTEQQNDSLTNEHQNDHIQSIETNYSSFEQLSLPSINNQQQQQQQYQDEKSSIEEIQIDDQSSLPLTSTNDNQLEETTEQQLQFNNENFPPLTTTLNEETTEQQLQLNDENFPPLTATINEETIEKQLELNDENFPPLTTTNEVEHEETTEKQLELNDENFPPLSSTTLNNIQHEQKNEEHIQKDHQNDSSLTSTIIRTTDYQNDEDKISFDDIKQTVHNIEHLSNEEIKSSIDEQSYSIIDSQNEFYENNNSRILSENNIEYTMENIHSRFDQALKSTINQETNLIKDNQNQFEDILKNKTLLKKILIEGQPNTHPTRSSLTEISYQLYLVDLNSSEDRLIEQIDHEKFYLGENDTINAIDVALLHMNKGEKSLIDSDIRHCYGQNGCEEKNIPVFNDNHPYRMKILLELHQWNSPVSISHLSNEERISWGNKKRLMGNFHYRRGDYQKSIQCYLGAVRFLNVELNPTNDSKILIENYIQVQNNLAQVYLSLNNFQSCLQSVQNVLKYDQNNPKALFRKGKALFQLGQYQETIETLKLFLQLQTNNSTEIEQAKSFILNSQQKLNNYQQNEKEIYRRMFSNSQQQQQQNKQTTNDQNDQQSNSNWNYFLLGSAVLAAIGFAIFIRNRRLT